MRICIFAGPGAGKSTLAMRLTAMMKELHYHVDYVHEWIKQWAYEKKVPKGWDQHKIFGEQIYLESSKLQSGLNHIVTDSPVLMQYAYMKRDNQRYAPECLSIAKMFEEEYPAFNIRLLRGAFEYQQQGRYETLEQAVEMDNQIKALMDEHLSDYVEYLPTDYDSILRDLGHRMKCC